MRPALAILFWAAMTVFTVNVGVMVEQLRREREVDAARAAARSALDRNGYSHVEEVGTGCFVTQARDRKGEAVWAWACPNGKKYVEPTAQPGPDEI